MKLLPIKKRLRNQTQNAQPVSRKQSGRIEMLRRKLAIVHGQMATAAEGGDFLMKGMLDAEAANLRGTILRAESLVARQIVD